MVDCCRLVLPYNAVHSIQQTEQIPNDPPQMGAKSTTTSNHSSTPTGCLREIRLAMAEIEVRALIDTSAARTLMAEETFLKLCKHIVRPTLIKPTGSVCELGAKMLPVVGSSRKSLLYFTFQHKWFFR